MASKRKKLSGAENRKRKMQELDLISKMPSITSFGTVKRNSAPLAPTGKWCAYYLTITKTNSPCSELSITLQKSRDPIVTY